MGINSITSTNSMLSMQMNTAGSTDTKSKKVQDEITSAEQQLKKLSSTQELSVAEKNNERQKIQKEISSLNTELKQHQEELSRSQKREAMMAKLLEDKKPANEEKSEDKVQAKETSSDKADEKTLLSNRQTEQPGTVIADNDDGTVILKEETNPANEAKEDSAEKKAENTNSDKAADAGLSQKEMHAIVSSDASVQQASRQGAVIAKTRDGIAIFKGEMRQNERRGIDTEKAQAELEKMKRQEQRATAFQSSTLGEANNTMKSATEANGAGTKNQTQVNAENNGFNNPFINALNASQQEEKWASQQMFQVSLGH
ncbi:MAG: hypothetical protein HDR00_05410 [Lachnospiraceae bacterium]|nr:hypothetical protein [Lachnospiraceae bacterium]